MNDVHDDASAYALDALPDEERAFFERHLGTCADCRREVASFREALAGLDDRAEPPPALRARVLDEVARTPQDAAAPAAPAGRTRRAEPAAPGAPDPGVAPVSRPAAWGRRLAAAAAAVVLLATGAALGAAVAGGGDDALDDPPAWLAGADVVALDAPEGAQARLLYSPEADRGVLVASGLPAVDPDEATYELWVLRDGTPQPAGLFNPDEGGEVVTEATTSLAGADAVAVTVEPPGGSDAPTSDILLQGALR